MPMLLFLIFLAVPIIEIALFIEAGRLIGIVPTIAITIGTAIAGSFLMRLQGLRTLNRFTQAVENGEMPVTPVLDGLGILVAGVLLLTPGLFTDAIGLLLFVPPIRRKLARWLFERALSKGVLHVRTFGGSRSDASGAGPGSDPRPRSRSPKRENVVDAEFETASPDEGEHMSQLTPDNGRRDSPWRKG